jgi:HlyD family secretion protein
MKAGHRRTLIWGIIGAAVATALAWSFQPEPVPVDVTAVTRGPLHGVVEDEGRTRVRDPYVVSAPVAGRLLRVAYRAGDEVEAGSSVLAQLLPTDPGFLDARSRAQAQASVRAADASRRLAAAGVSEAQAQLNYARTELKRFEALAARGLVSQMELENARLAERRASAGIEAARSALNVREQELQNARMLLADFPSSARDESAPVVTMRSPISGRVLRVLQQSESVVAAGTPLLEIGDPARLEVLVDLLSSDAAQLREGADAVISDWGGKNLMARLRRVSPSGFTKISALGVEEQRVTAYLDIVEPRSAWTQLGDGFRVNAAITIWDVANAVRVPQSALFRNGEEWNVFLARGNRAVQRAVKIGHANALDAEVVSGLQPGDRVIAHPSDKVTDGAAIALRSG